MRSWAQRRGTSGLASVERSKSPSHTNSRVSPPTSRGAEEHGLTPREREILQQLVEGLKIRQIADELHLSVHTVGNHLRSIYHKLHVRSRSSAVAKALREEGYELLRGPAAMIIDPWLTEVLEEDGSAWVDVPPAFETGRSLAQLDLRARTGVSVVAVEREGTRTVNPPPSHVIRAGDRLLVLGSPDDLGRLRAALEEPPPASPD